jgi:PKD repeat protein
VEFTVTATGTAPLEYQWRKDNADLAGATNSTYVIASATTADAGTYTVVVRNAAGSRTSEPATLTVLPPPPPPQIAAPSLVTEDGKTFLSIAFTTINGASYQVQSTLDLAAQPIVWTDEGTAVPGTGAVVSVRIQIGSAGQVSAPQKFFRVVTK